jgi:osmotically-inducible protein OsmY
VTGPGTGATADAYVVAHVREALAADGRVAELGIDVERTGDALVLLGRVASAGRREAAAVVAAEQAPGFRIVNELDVVEAVAPPGPPEQLR